MIPFPKPSYQLHNVAQPEYNHFQIGRQPGVSAGAHRPGLPLSTQPGMYSHTSSSAPPDRVWRQKEAKAALLEQLQGSVRQQFNASTFRSASEKGGGLPGGWRSRTEGEVMLVLVRILRANWATFFAEEWPGWISAHAKKHTKQP